MNQLEVRNVTLELNSNVILENLNYQFKSNQVYGIVGANGCGKTMFFRVISGLLRPNSGEIVYNELQLYKDVEVLPSCGIILENVGLYPELSVLDNLLILTRLRKIVGRDRVLEVLKKVGLEANNKPFKKLSLGMKKRAVLAQAILEYNEVLILDEPSAALDEEGKALLHQIINEERERGAIVLISSHDKNDIHTLCDVVITVKNHRFVEVPND